MKAKLEFNLPDDEEEYRMCTEGSRYYSALFTVKENLRRKIKHSELTEEQYEIYTEIYEQFLDTLCDLDISL